MRKENIWKRRKALSAFPPSVDWEFSAKKLFPTFFPFLLLLRGERVSRWPRSGNQRITCIITSRWSPQIDHDDEEEDDDHHLIIHIMTSPLNHHNHCPHLHPHFQHDHLIPSMTTKKRRAARTKMRQERIQIANAVRPVASEGVAWTGLWWLSLISHLSHHCHHVHPHGQDCDDNCEDCHQ